jgi:glucose/arabinose dehydrogenase
VTVVASGLQVPWGLTFLPDGSALVGERTTARIHRIAGGAATIAMTVPDVDTGAGEGGLLGLVASPTYASDQLVYAYFTTKDDNRIARFKLGDSPSPILTGPRRGIIHNGGRIAFGPDGMLYAGVGDTGDRTLPQDLASSNGKILRIAPDGTVPADNPFPGSPVWTFGHRNVQGLAWDSANRMWATEFGQDRFDEVNLIEKGKDYGWPLVEGFGDTDGGRFTNPLVTWPTDQASPSGCAIAGGVLYIGALQGRDLLRVRLSGAAAVPLSPLAKGTYGRLRTVVHAPDGSLWVTTSNRDGRGSPQAGDDHVLRFVV